MFPCDPGVVSYPGRFSHLGTRHGQLTRHFTRLGSPRSIEAVSLILQVFIKAYTPRSPYTKSLTKGLRIQAYIRYKYTPLGPNRMLIMGVVCTIIGTNNIIAHLLPSTTGVCTSTMPNLSEKDPRKWGTTDVFEFLQDNNEEGVLEEADIYPSEATKPPGTCWWN